ncbi:DUF5675 family protein [Campylobacter upsaliensis]|nr:DUF5675 family protein [Campylobacter upsaliensis]MCA5589822.1 DUF5675 family protein [Campylobacter upsaliensis]
MRLLTDIKARSCVIGKFKVYDENGDLTFQCFSLQEDPAGLESGKELKDTRGRYKLKRHPHHSRFEATLRKLQGMKKDEMLNVYNDLVPYERHILIHWGNTDKDTQVLYYLLVKTKKTSDESIGGSRASYGNHFII